MNFDSEYVLEEEEEESEEEEEPEPMPSFQRPRRPERYFEDNSSGFECEIMEFDDEEELPHAPKKEKSKKVDPNTVSLTMSSLAEKSDKVLSKNQLTFCDNKECGAAFSYLDNGEPKPGENGKNVWVCKFCGYNNYPELAEGVVLERLGRDLSDVLYVEDVEKLPNMKPSGKGNFKIIFVIDTSASMCQTTAVKSSDMDQTLRDIVTREREMSQQLMLGMHGGDNQMIQQFMQMIPGLPMLGGGNAMGNQGQRQNEDQMEVTRLQAIKAAIIRQIEKLKAEDPTRCVGLVAFSEKVVLYGDGTRDKVTTIEGGQLSDIDELQMMAQNFVELRPISESADDLTRIIKDLREEGRTALGPALVVAQEMITLASRGSKIILCTDGFANIGLGKLEETNETDIAKFYERVIMIGKIKAMSVSIICFDEAGIKTDLGNVPSETGGILEKIKATEFTEHLNTELTTQTVATNAEIKFVVHKDMYVKKEKDKDDMHSMSNYLIGNIREDKRIPFTFAIRPQKPAKDDQTSKDKPCCSQDPSCSQAQGSDSTTASCPSSTPASDATPPDASSATASSPASDATPPDASSATASSSASDAKTSMDTSQPLEDARSSSTSQTPPMDDGKMQCPFQVQITYTDMDGVRACRVWTKEKPVTKNREVAEKAINTDTALTTFFQKSSEEILNEKCDRKQKAVEKIGEVETWQSKLKDKDVTQWKKLNSYRELLNKVAFQSYNDDLALALRNFKEGRPGTAQA